MIQFEKIKLCANASGSAGFKKILIFDVYLQGEVMNFEKMVKIEKYLGEFTVGLLWTSITR